MLNKGEILFRIFDIFFAIFFLILSSPLILLISVCIKLSDLKNPVFAENHWRVGKDGKKFFMYKFRTMIPNAHELLNENPQFKNLKQMQRENRGKLKIKDDIRITPIGKIIRRLDMDELPQFLNVLKGDMSLVGPRAYFDEEIVEYSREFKEFDEKIGDVLKVKPGITGLWQISGRNLLSISERIRYDYEYSKKRGIILYILILSKTPYIVLTRYGVCE
jgi:exopolysaccharide production protein ExoY